MSQPLLKVKNLSFRYGRKEIINEVSFSIEKGELFGLLGPNGAGKTTIIKLIAGLLRKRTGVMKLLGKDITHLPIEKRVKEGLAYLPQEPSVFGGLSVADNMRLVVEESGKRIDESKEKIENLLESLQLSALKKAKAKTLSGGERRRLEIAKALLLSPVLLVVDEPFSGIDPIGIRAMREIFESLIAKDIGILLTDHNVHETLKICHRSIILNEGAIIAEGDKKALLEDPNARRSYLGDEFT